MKIQKLSDEAVTTWLAAHPAWRRESAGGGAIARDFAFADFADALAFVVAVGMVAQARDHHPDVTLGWGKASLRWSTHDAGGLSERDLTLAEESDARFASFAQVPPKS